jgi:hypothetical protein
MRKPLTSTGNEMRKSGLSKRTDEQLIAAITARLDYKPATRTAIQDSVQVGLDLSTRLLGIMLENGDIETYRGKAGTHVCELYCIAGRCPRPPAHSLGSARSSTGLYAMDATRSR